MYRPAPRPLMLVSPPGVAASYRRGESLSRGFSILEAEAPMPRGQRGSDGSLQGAASHNGQCDVTGWTYSATLIPRSLSRYIIASLPRGTISTPLHRKASLLRSTGRPAASSYRPGDGHGHAALKALRSKETTGVCRKKSLWSGNSAIALRMWRMPTSTICAAVGWGEVG
jgi:hypothetical protein